MCITPFIISVIYNTEHFELLRSRCVYNAVRTFCYYYIFILYFYRTSFLILFNRIFTFRSKNFFISYTVSLQYLSISINETRLVENCSTFIMRQSRKIYSTMLQIKFELKFFTMQLFVLQVDISLSIRSPPYFRINSSTCCFVRTEESTKKLARN